MPKYPTYFQTTELIDGMALLDSFILLTGNIIIAPGYTLPLCVSVCLYVQLTNLVCSSVCL